MPLSSTAGLKLAPPALIQGSKAPELEELDDEELLEELLEEELEELDVEALEDDELEDVLDVELELLARPVDEFELDEDELDAPPSTSGPLQAVVASTANRVSADKAIRLMAKFLNKQRLYSAEPCHARL